MMLLLLHVLHFFKINLATFFFLKIKKNNISKDNICGNIAKLIIGASIATSLICSTSAGV